MWANLASALLGARLDFHRGPLPGEPEGDSFRDVGGVRIRYRESGSGPAVVFIHGFAASLEMWQRTIAAAGRGRRSICLDLKGFGWSGRPAGDYSHEAQAALVLELLAQLGVADAAVVGHSWGASVALALALRAPERVRRLALYSAWVYQEQLPPLLPLALLPRVGESLFGFHYRFGLRHRLAMAFHDPCQLSPELLAGMERAVALPGSAAAALAAMRAMDLAAQQDRYPLLRCPSLLLWGEDDWVTPLSAGRRLARDLRAPLRTYPSCGHFPMLEAAQASDADLFRFLEEDA